MNQRHSPTTFQPKVRYQTLQLYTKSPKSYQQSSSYHHLPIDKTRTVPISQVHAPPPHTSSHNSYPVFSATVSFTSRFFRLVGRKAFGGCRHLFFVFFFCLFCFVPVFKPRHPLARAIFVSDLRPHFCQPTAIVWPPFWD